MPFIQGHGQMLIAKKARLDAAQVSYIKCAGVNHVAEDMLEEIYPVETCYGFLPNQTILIKVENDDDDVKIDLNVPISTKSVDWREANDAEMCFVQRTTDSFLSIEVFEAFERQRLRMQWQTLYVGHELFQVAVPYYDEKPLELVSYRPSFIARLEAKRYDAEGLMPFEHPDLYLGRGASWPPRFIVSEKAKWQELPLTDQRSVNLPLQPMTALLCERLNRMNIELYKFGIVSNDTGLDHFSDFGRSAGASAVSGAITDLQLIELGYACRDDVPIAWYSPHSFPGYDEFLANASDVGLSEDELVASEPDWSRKYALFDSGVGRHTVYLEYWGSKKLSAIEVGQIIFEVSTNLGLSATHPTESSNAIQVGLSECERAPFFR